MLTRRDPGFDVWVVVADVLIGFLCLVFLLFIAHVKPVAYSRPPAVVKFETELRDHRERSGSRFAVDSEFSKVHLSYQEGLLFRECEWTISDSGRMLLKQHFAILWAHREAVARIQIEGHADSRPAAGCLTLQSGALRRDNWVLSSLRALEVRDFLEWSLGNGMRGRFSWAPEDDGLLRKIEAVGRGDLHPIDPANPASEVNRRLEITVHFVEPRSRM